MWFSIPSPTPENYDYDSNEDDYETISDDDYDSVPEGIAPPVKGL